MKEGAAVREDMSARVIDALGVVRCGADDTEEALHAQVARALENAGIDAAHEVHLAPRCRIDFMAGRIGVEIKKRRPERAKLIAQLSRYAACDQVEALVVVAPRGVDLPAHIGGKSVSMVALERLWGISLP